MLALPLLLLLLGPLVPADLQIVQQTYLTMLKTGVLQEDNAFQQILNLAMNQTANVGSISLNFIPPVAVGSPTSTMLCI
jgi:hypothetical protein